MLVMKFGGTSVGSGERILRVAEIALAQIERQPVIVTSAMSGVTDALLALADVALTGDHADCEARLAVLEARHQEAAQVIDPGGDWDELAAQFVGLRQEIAAATDAREPLPARDAIAAYGERLAVVLLARAVATCARHIPGILGCYASDGASGIAQPLIATDDHFGEATPDLTASQSLAGKAFADATVQGAVLVAPGFIGRAADGRTTTLGRGGSDYAATLIAAALGADACWIYTDVDGVFTADPRVVPGAQVLPVVAFAAAGRLALCGAKVLHPRSVAPAARAGFELRVRNTFQPEREGTLLVASSATTQGMPLAVAGRKKLASVALHGAGLMEILNLFARLCQALAEADAEIVLAAQPVPGHDPQVIIDAARCDAARAALECEFARERAQGQVSAIQVQHDLALCTIVGDAMPPGVLSQAQCALAQERINPLTQSAAPEALTFILATAYVDRALRRLHQDIILPALREVQLRHQRPYADGQWAAGGRPEQRRRHTLPQH
jgi:aspartate kinase